MLGWLTLAAARASRQNRCRAVSSRRRDDIVFSATSVEAFVTGGVDHAHPAFAELALDRVVADARRDGPVWRRSRATVTSPVGSFGPLADTETGADPVSH